MIVEINIPTPGESITEVELASWLIEDGTVVEKDQELAEIESDKATLSLLAIESGKIKLLVEAGDTVKVGAVACTIDTDYAVEKSNSKVVDDLKEEAQPKEVSSQPNEGNEISKGNEVKADAYEHVKISPLAKKQMEEANLSVEDVINGLKRIGVHEVTLSQRPSENESSLQMEATREASRDVNRQKMSQLRRKLAKRLVSVVNETAMLTTFNEVDMSAIMKLRKKYQSSFMEKHQVKLGFMSFFIKASAVAMKHHPMVNSMIDGDQIITPEYVDVSVAVQTPKGLMVPVLRNVESKSLAEIESELKRLAEKARSAKISLEEMTGGTFTITNGGVFGSMLSTPVINPPQSAILGMHNILERPVAINGQVVIRPMMYVALSYDHRLIDGKDSVGFLVNVKEMLEDPLKLLLQGEDPEKLVLGL
jgi:2-oxoglutarate dehydrogenase E2 component (dihydrolipoamide succinyltransferase)